MLKHLSKEHKQKLSLAHIGKIPWNKGKIYSEKLRKKMSEEQKGKHHSEETKIKIGLNGFHYGALGRKHTKEELEKMSLAHKGKKRPPFSEEWRKNIGESQKGHKSTYKQLEGLKLGRYKGKKVSEKAKINMSIAQIGKHLGEKSGFWRGGKMTEYPEKVKIRKSNEYIFWRRAVYVRDNFSCQKYGILGGKLVAHHINNFEDFPELRLAIDNGITLSEKAHREFHNIYGNQNNTKEQLNEFLKFRWNK